MSNLRQIELGIGMYREDHQTFPDQLSQLRGIIGALRIFVSPRRAGRSSLWEEGPLHRWLGQPDPGRERQIRSWSEVDGGDYLYRKPPNDAPTNTIMVMTRPGLLHRNWINVVFEDGHVEKMEPKFWKNRPDVIEFLKQTGAAPP